LLLLGGVADPPAWSQEEEEGSSFLLERLPFSEII
jgi:hypothetical protein